MDVDEMVEARRAEGGWSDAELAEYRRGLQSAVAVRPVSMPVTHDVTEGKPVRLVKYARAKASTSYGRWQRETLAGALSEYEPMPDPAAELAEARALQDDYAVAYAERPRETAECLRAVQSRHRGQWLTGTTGDIAQWLADVGIAAAVVLQATSLPAGVYDASPGGMASMRADAAAARL